MISIKDDNKEVLTLTYIMTENCNFACKYCYVPHNKRFNNISIEVLNQSFNFIETIINDYSGIAFDLFGGEPLLAWEECKLLIEKVELLIKKYPEKSFRIVVFTNGTQFNDQKLTYLRQKKYISFNFSLDGCKEVNDMSRVHLDGSGTFDDIMSNIQLFKQYYPEVNVVFKSMISPHNVESIVYSAEKMLELGYKRISYSMVRDDVWDKESIEQYKTNIEKLSEFYITNIDKGIWYDVFLYPILDCNINKLRKKYCAAGSRMYAITPNGDIYPCQRFYNNRSPYKIGDVWKGIDHNNTWYNVFKKSTLNNFIGCSSCSDFSGFNCPGQCMAAMYESSKNIFKPISNVCELIKFNKQIAHKIYEQLKDNPNYKKALDINKYGG